MVYLRTISPSGLEPGDHRLRRHLHPLVGLHPRQIPLTYVADPHAPAGRRPELDIYVNVVKWRRALSFHKATAHDEIYLIRHDADHNTLIQFGDGELGKRLPTGANNIVATYRFGVGGNQRKRRRLVVNVGSWVPPSGMPHPAMS